MEVREHATAARTTDAERAGREVESAGAARASDRALEPVIQREQEIRDERLMQEREHELSLNGSGSWMALRWDGD